MIEPAAIEIVDRHSGSSWSIPIFLIIVAAEKGEGNSISYNAAPMIALRQVTLAAPPAPGGGRQRPDPPWLAGRRGGRQRLRQSSLSPCWPANCTPKPAPSRCRRLADRPSPRKRRPLPPPPSTSSSTAMPNCAASRPSWRRPKPRATAGHRPPARPLRRDRGLFGQGPGRRGTARPGFSDADFARPVAEFSGGWRVRLNLAAPSPAGPTSCSSTNPPTTSTSTPSSGSNLAEDDPQHPAAHFPRPGFFSTAGGRPYRRHRPAAPVAHQRRLLRLQAEPGRPARRPAGHLRSAAKQIAHLQRFIDRFRPRPPRPARPRAGSRPWPAWRLSPPPTSTRPFISISACPPTCPTAAGDWDSAAGYGGRQILTGLNLTPAPGQPHRTPRAQRRGQIDPGQASGRGAAPWPPASGEAKALSIGFFRPAPAGAAPSRRIALQHLTRLEPTTPEQELRDYLGIRFPRRHGDRPAGPFSGGENPAWRWRCLSAPGPILLLLDEPTNHLDLEMREALTFALQVTRAGSSSSPTATCCASAPTNSGSSPAAPPASSTAISTTTPPGSPPGSAPSVPRRRKPPEKSERLQQRAKPRPTARPCSPSAAPWSKEIERLELTSPNGTEKSALEAQFADPPSTPRWTAPAAKNSTARQPAWRPHRCRQLRWLELH